MSDYVYYAQRRDKPADPMMGQAFLRRYEMENWLKGREDLFVCYRYKNDWRERTCKVIS